MTAQVHKVFIRIILKLIMVYCRASPAHRCPRQRRKILEKRKNA